MLFRNKPQLVATLRNEKVNRQAQKVNRKSTGLILQLFNFLIFFYKNLILSKDIFFIEFFILDFSLSKFFQPVDSKKVNAKRTNRFEKHQSIGITVFMVRSFLKKRTKKKERPVD
jgi:hypothetical protein